MLNLPRAFEIKDRHNKTPPPKEILEDLTARGGDLLTRTLDTFRQAPAEDAEASGEEEVTTPNGNKMDIDEPGSGTGRSTRGDFICTFCISESAINHASRSETGSSTTGSLPARCIFIETDANRDQPWTVSATHECCSRQLILRRGKSAQHAPQYLKLRAATTHATYPSRRCYSSK